MDEPNAPTETPINTIKHNNEWSKQEQLKADGHIPTQNEIMTIAKSFKKQEYTVLFLLTYLTAGRISEVIDLKKDDFQIVYKKERKALLITMPNRKHKVRHIKSQAIPLDKEGELVQPILNYIADKDGRLFKQRSTCWAWNVFNLVGYNPHWLRHIRLTHMETIYGLSAERLKVFAGWTDSRPAKNYLEMNWGDVLDGM